MPLQVLAKGEGLSRRWFELGDRFRATVDVAEDDRELFEAMTEEVVARAPFGSTSATTLAPSSSTSAASESGALDLAVTGSSRMGDSIAPQGAGV
jgi:hypothetical protein